ncbi:MAG TPA: DinB family protein [Acidimicrobiales bacterium]|nr:DinB family protein [Acidimicrobiales bacterium]
MPDDEAKAVLLRYLRTAREAVVWKLDGLSEYDARRPVVPTGTNLLGLVKHLACVEAEYLGVVFGRPFSEPMPWTDGDADPNDDMWATPEETREVIVDLYRRAWAHADATVDSLPLDAQGRVPWWPPERAGVTLHTVLVHITAETNRHAGHADIVRELVDGAAGLRPDSSNLPPGDRSWWEGHRARVEAAAREAAARAD